MAFSFTPNTTNTSQQPNHHLISSHLLPIMALAAPNITTTTPTPPTEIVLSPAASWAFVIASAFLCFVLIFLYCRYCGGDTDTYRHMIKRPASPPVLPLVCYDRRKEITAGGGCVVCLSEFEEEEEVKVIPGCGHVFHPKCIDGWLARRCSCPVCRCSEMFGSGLRRVEEGVGDGVCDDDQVIREEEVVRLERSRSWCSSSEGGERAAVFLHRTNSF